MSLRNITAPLPVSSIFYFFPSADNGYNQGGIPDPYQQQQYGQQYGQQAYGGGYGGQGGGYY